MTENQIIEEVLRYLSDESYNYAILIDGEWGCGKTYFVQHALRTYIEEEEKKSKHPRKFKYISLYGCKSIQDIQEDIVWTVVEEIGEKYKNKDKNSYRGTKIGSSVLLSSKKITNAVLKRITPEANVYDLITDWFDAKSYIFVFDDIERCDCALNEVFGFINGLVEHEGTKVILVANEREISVRELNSQKELQYSLVLNNNIEWPAKKETYPIYKKKDNNEKVSLELLEERRKKLFDEEIDGSYRKIREKLIGVTLCYQPDIQSIIKNMIENNDIKCSLKKVLQSNMVWFYSIMDRYKHHNLRTFQFFLSKICYLHSIFWDIGIEREYEDEVTSFIVQDCFMWAVQFKGNIPVPTDRWEWAEYQARKKSAAIKKYVEMGEFDKDEFEMDLNKYIDSELKNKISENDPMSLLNREWYIHTQEWCEEQLKKIKQNLRENNYPLSSYSNIIKLVVYFTEIGFSVDYLKEMKEIMLENVQKTDNPQKIDDELISIEDEERKRKIRENIDEINLEILARDKTVRQKNIEEILCDKDWVNELREYTEMDDYRLAMDISVFSKAKPEQWIHAIQSSSSKDLDSFCYWMRKHYPYNSMRENVKIDIPTLESIVKGITEDDNDLIKRLHLSWLKEHIKKVIQYYKDSFGDNI